MFDGRCYDLAEIFLEGTCNTEKNKYRLAQAIQDAIEDELKDIDTETAKTKPE